MFLRLKETVESSNTQAGRFFDLFIQTLIVVSIITFSVETLPDLEAEMVETLYFMETIIVCIFSIEYILRVFVADRKLSFIFSFEGIIDLASILPFFVSGVDLRSLRVFRLLKLFRFFKVTRYSRAIRRFQRAFVMVKEELILFALVATMLIYLSAVGIYYCEHEAQPELFKSIFHSLWWSVITLTTVGYGDVYPVTLLGRMFTFVLLMLSIIIIAIPAGLLASALSKVKDYESPMDFVKTKD